MFSMVVPAYADKYGVDPDEMKRVLARIASKNHANGARNPRAQFRKRRPVEEILRHADGGRRAQRVRLRRRGRRRGRRHRGPGRGRPPLHRHPLYIKALSSVAGDGKGLTDPDYDYTTFPEIVGLRRRRLRPGRHHRPAPASWPWPRCTTASPPTELVLMEDLGFAERGTAWKDVLAGAFDLDGDLPVNPDGGLKSFGHPVGASGLRMMFEGWLQLRDEAGDRQIDTGRGLGPHPQPGRLPGRDGVRASPCSATSSPEPWPPPGRTSSSSNDMNRSHWSPSIARPYATP